jgi:hypothetical protein
VEAAGKVEVIVNVMYLRIIDREKAVVDGCSDVCCGIREVWWLG